MVWEKLLFMHWPVEAGALRRLIPAGLAIDTFEGRAWVGVVPFAMSISPRGVGVWPVRRNFCELNVRTYVTVETGRGPRPGVWFFSLDCEDGLSVRAARGVGLPYYHAEMAMGGVGAGGGEPEIVYRSVRRHGGYPDGRLEMRYAPVGAGHINAEGTLEAFLTERYCLYCPATTAGRAAQRAAEQELPPGAAAADAAVRRIDIHHRPWALAPARARIEHNTMCAPLGLELHGAPLLHYADRLEVYTWPPMRV